MDYSKYIIGKVFTLFRVTFPRLRLRFSTMIENRKVTIEAKKVRVAPDFNQKYKSIIKPYWKKYGVKPHKNSFKVLCPEGKAIDPRYISNGLWTNDILSHFNSIIDYSNLANKSLQPMFVPDLKKPETILQYISDVFYDKDFNPITEEEVCRLCRQEGTVIMKQSYASFGGYGVAFFDARHLTDQEVIDNLHFFKDDVIVQSVISQHKVLSDINPGSINTLRIVTFYFKGEVHILSTLLRMGSGDSKVDNVSQGGFACRVHPDGRLDKYAVSRVSSWNTVHPGGTVFESVVIPNYTHIIETVKNAARKVPFFKILGWDIAINAEGEPVFIEFNVRPEQNQKTCGPTFGDITEEVLADVYLKEPRPEVEEFKP